MHQEDFLTNSSSSSFRIGGRDMDYRLAGKINFVFTEVSYVSISSHKAIFHVVYILFLNVFNKPLLTKVSMKQNISLFPEMLKKFHLKMNMLNNILGRHVRRGIILLHLFSLFKMVL